MIFKKAFKFCLRPTKAQEEKFAQFAGATRWIYNRGLAERKNLWDKEQRSITLYEQNNALVAMKKEHTWLADVHSQALQQSLNDLDRAYTNFFRRLKNKETPGYPRFKCKGEHDAFRYPQGMKVEGKHVWLPKIGWVKFRKSREINGVIKQTTIVKEGNRWYISFSCLCEQPDLAIAYNDCIGIDMGIEHLATVATDQGIEEYGHPRFLQRTLEKLVYLSRALSKKKPKSKNRLKAKQKLSQLYTSIRNQRQDYLHKLSTQLVKSHDVIVVESLKIQKLLMEAPRKLARSISDAGWRSFLHMLKYKCEQSWKKLIEAPEYFPSTKRCSHCHKRNEIPLSMREYTCSCGLKLHRDHNAALNLKAVGMSVCRWNGGIKPVELPA